ncbi:PH domain-containing protein [Schaalia cardiffensis]|uniref:PH domain-containing protein n=1 Tax=Schaalia cardiffensis TaxID=181487 RepID=UPI0018E7CF72|nr:PH domain-containing protein [Schaalia cardiffensis]
MSVGGGAAPKIRATEGAIAEGQWRRLHPLSPLIKAWKGVTILLAIVLFQNTNLFVNSLSSDYAHSLGTGRIVLIAVGGLLGLVLILGLISYLSWRVTRFAVTDSGVYYRSGILLRTLKQARLERIQGVDIQHPLLGRVFGLGTIDIEVAGGAGSKVAFGFLKTQELEDLRAEILARASGVFSDATVAQAGSFAPHHSKAGVPVPGTNAGYGEGTPLPPAGASSPSATAGMTPRRFAPSAPERVLYKVPSGRLLGSLILTSGVFVGVLVLLAVLVGVGVLTTLIGAGGLSGVVGLLPILLAMGAIVWKRFAGEFNFTGAVSPDGIRTRSGLLETRSQTIPPNRIHAVRIQRPLLWRWVGWYRVTITQAGFAAQNQEETKKGFSTDLLLPVGTRADAELALWLVVRDLGVPDPQAFMSAALDGTGEGVGFIPVSTRARILDPLVKKRRAVALTQTCLVIRDGWLSWDLSVIPVERVQSLKLTQGPLERRLSLADVEAQIVPGTTPCRARHLDVSAAVGLSEGVRKRARIRRTKEPPERWLSRVQSRLDFEGRTGVIGEAGAVLPSGAQSASSMAGGQSRLYSQPGVIPSAVQSPPLMPYPQGGQPMPYPQNGQPMPYPQGGQPAAQAPSGQPALNGLTTPFPSAGQAGPFPQATTQPQIAHPAPIPPNGQPAPLPPNGQAGPIPETPPQASSAQPPFPEEHT